MATLYTVIGIIVGALCTSCLFVLRRLYNNDRLQNERRLLGLVETSKDILYYCEVNPDLKYRYLSPSIEEYLGLGIHEESFENAYAAFERIHPDDFEILFKKMKGKLDYSKPIIQRWRDNRGTYIWFEEYATPIYKKGKLKAIQGIIRNIDDKMKLQQELVYQVHHDVLTNIFNRVFFEEQMEKYNKGENVPVAIMLCDLDELKYLNDQFGHKTGDTLIKRAAQILNHFSSEGITVSRIGGDEFALLIIGYEEFEVQGLMSDIMDSIEHYNIDTTSHPIRISIGYAYSRHSFGRMDSLFVEADENMYRQKRAKKHKAVTIEVTT